MLPAISHNWVVNCTKQRIEGIKRRADFVGQVLLAYKHIYRFLPEMILTVTFCSLFIGLSLLKWLKIDITTYCKYMLNILLYPDFPVEKRLILIDLYFKWSISATSFWSD